MSKNQEIAGIFFEMAEILEMQNVQWKPRAYRQAARAIDSTPEPIEKIYKKGGLKLLKELPGVGEGIAKKIAEYLKTGHIKAYDNLKKKVPSHIGVLMKIPGMGPKKLKKLSEKLNIRTIAQLEKAARQHKIARLPLFGEKSEQDILDGIALMKTSKGRMPLRQAERIAAPIISKLKRLKQVKNISTAGSLRRKRATVGDIDILASSNKPKPIIDAFVKIPNKKVLGKGSTKATLVLKSGVQVDLRVVPPESWGAALLYFIGSKTYNIEARKIAIKKGYKLSEYGLYDKKTGKRVAGRTEKEICKKLGIKWIKPELREK
jgi:DNA polymerase (family 10)